MDEQALEKAAENHYPHKGYKPSKAEWDYYIEQATKDITTYLDNVQTDYDALLGDFDDFAESGFTMPTSLAEEAATAIRELTAKLETQRAYAKHENGLGYERATLEYIDQLQNLEEENAKLRARVNQLTRQRAEIIAAHRTAYALAIDEDAALKGEDK